MKPVQIVMLAVVLAVAALIVVLALRNPQPPMLPADEAHAEFDGAESCRVCHGPDGPSPQSPNHPLGADCLRCHGRR